MNVRYGLRCIFFICLLSVFFACNVIPERRVADVPVMDGALHVTQEGESLGAIAKTYNVSVPLLRRVNNVSDMGALPKGTRLFIPGATELKTVDINTETAPVSKPDGLYHPVRAGQTLSTIAKAYDITMTELQEVNNLYDPNLLKAGDQVWIPRAKEVAVVAVPTVTIVSAEPVKTVTPEPRVTIKVQPTPTPTPKVSTKAAPTPKEVEFPRKISTIKDIDFQWPLKDKFTILQDYNPAIYSFGLDLGDEVGTPVYAAADGEVESVGAEGDKELGDMLGNHVFIFHGIVDGKNLRTIYGYNKSVSVKVGDKVKRGDQIGVMGNSGPGKSYDTGVLHFEIRMLIDSLNPMEVLPPL
jgi:murein DD-endopeptidase MepM/ murein hydrolase activator NlpD